MMSKRKMWCIFITVLQCLTMLFFPISEDFVTSAFLFSPQYVTSKWLCFKWKLHILKFLRASLGNGRAEESEAITPNDSLHDPLPIFWWVVNNQANLLPMFDSMNVVVFPIFLSILSSFGDIVSIPFLHSLVLLLI